VSLLFGHRRVPRVRDFAGLTCDALVAREFWLGDRRVCAASYVFLSLGDGTAVGWWFDDDPCVWRSEPVDAVAVPGTAEGWVAEDGTPWRYPHIDLAAQLGVRGWPLSRWAAVDAGPVPGARLEFADGSAVLFTYDCRAESDWVQIAVQSRQTEPGDAPDPARPSAPGSS
jgi:hypothetical protein